MLLSIQEVGMAATKYACFDVLYFFCTSIIAAAHVVVIIIFIFLSGGGTPAGEFF